MLKLFYYFFHCLVGCKREDLDGVDDNDTRYATCRKCGETYKKWWMR